MMPSTYDLAGRSAIVTGGAKGIGRAIAERLLAEGARVFVWDINHAHIPGAESLVVDITRADQVAACLSRVANQSRIDILVNDAGYLGKCQPFLGHMSSDWHRIIEVNLIGTMRVTQAVLPYMLRQNGGRIINMGSLAGKEGLTDLAAYSAA